MATKSTSVAKVKAKRDIVKIDVKFTLNTPDGLRRVTFELLKDVNGDLVKWTITFQLFERSKKSDPFGDAIVDLLVEVDSKLNSKAEAMADNGMTTSQSAFAIGPAADTAKDAEAGLVSQKKAKTMVQNTLNK
jgi:hypothetical protein